MENFLTTISQASIVINVTMPQMSSRSWNGLEGAPQNENDRNDEVGSVATTAEDHRCCLVPPSSLQSTQRLRGTPRRFIGVAPMLPWGRCMEGHGGGPQISRSLLRPRIRAPLPYNKVLDSRKDGLQQNGDAGFLADKSPSVSHVQLLGGRPSPRAECLFSSWSELDLIVLTRPVKLNGPILWRVSYLYASCSYLYACVPCWQDLSRVRLSRLERWQREGSADRST